MAVSAGIISLFILIIIVAGVLVWLFWTSKVKGWLWTRRVKPKRLPSLLFYEGRPGEHTFCPHCGARVADQGRYCAKCGKALLE